MSWDEPFTTFDPLSWNEKHDAYQNIQNNAGFLCVTPFPLPKVNPLQSRKAQCLSQTSLNRGRLVPEVTLAFLPSQQKRPPVANPCYWMNKFCL